MATVNVLEKKQKLTRSADIGEFLQRQGIAFQRWPMPVCLKLLRGQPVLTEAEKAQVLKGYQKHLDTEAKQRGYVQADMVVLSPATPGLMEILARFDKTHFHDDDEVRYIFDGEGVFGFEPAGAPSFTLTVTAGDYIIVPAKTYHWFSLTETKSIKALRLFKDMAGWVPHYKHA